MNNNGFIFLLFLVALFFLSKYRNNFMNERTKKKEKNTMNYLDNGYYYPSLFDPYDNHIDYYDIPYYDIQYIPQTYHISQTYDIPQTYHIPMRFRNKRTKNRRFKQKRMTTMKKTKRKK